MRGGAPDSLTRQLPCTYPAVSTRWLSRRGTAARVSIYEKDCSNEKYGLNLICSFAHLLIFKFAHLLIFKFSNLLIY